MGTEIERKFLVRGDAWRDAARGTRLRQGYLSSDPARTVRVRSAGAAAWLTIKGPPEGLVRAEFEYPIPVADATILLDTLCERPLIDKVRHVVEYAGHTWEIDEFQGENAGLVVAEVELEHADEPVQLPPWVGAEVTDDPRYQNANLVRAPYTRWRDQK
ncbi:MAG: CYTH domain-containing protein [Pseudomonadales bacterium]|nr:CYTH domain-containing protein [Pseudomonadales bacterium]